MPDVSPRAQWDPPPPARDAERDSAGADDELDESRENALWRRDSRRLRNGLIGLLIFGGLVMALLLAVPGLRSAAERMTDAQAGWIAVAVLLELLSCASYVILFERVFARLRRRLASRLSLSELAMNSVVSAGGLGGFALGAWVLHAGGAPLRRVAERSVVMFLMTSAVNVAAVAVFGLLMWLGVLPGSSDPLLTLLPAAAAVCAIVGTLGLAAWARARLRGVDHDQSRRLVALAALSEGVDDAIAMIREPDWRVWGAVGYWLFDNLVLLACFYAYGGSPAVGAVVLGYLLGMLANIVPIPGGLGAVEGGIFGMLILFGERPATLVLAAVLTYRAIALWIPTVIGTAAFWSVRSELGKPLVQPAERPAMDA
jgi:uncharacterized membrane protein YbhN (UPF0104 family)